MVEQYATVKNPYPSGYGSSKYVMIKERKIPNDIKTFKDLILFLKLDENYEDLINQLDLTKSINNSKNIYDLMLNKLIDYEMYKNLCFYYDMNL